MATTRCCPDCGQPFQHGDRARTKYKAGVVVIEGKPPGAWGGMYWDDPSNGRREWTWDDEWATLAHEDCPDGNTVESPNGRGT